MDELVALCKRRGFIFQSNEIYGGLQGSYAYGPLGVELKNNIKSAWWSSMVYENDNIEGLDASILTNPLVLKHSGHESTFSDPMVDCKKCQSRWRADQLPDNKCLSCGSTDLTDPRPFNLMFKTNIGPVEDGGSFAYLRPETAQQIFINFKNVLDFGSGYGRVSRFLPYYFKDAQIQVSEVKPIAMEFQKEAFEFGTITHTEIASSFKSDPQDLIIGISVFTHIPVKAFIEWLDILFQNLKENGQLIFTFNDINKCPFGNNGKYHYQEQSEDSSNSGIPDKLDDVSQYGSTFYSQDYIIELLQVHSNKIEITRNFIGTHDAVILTR